MAQSDQAPAPETVRMGTVTLFLTGVAAVLGGMTIGFELLDIQPLVFLFRPATTVVILIIALFSGAIPSRNNKWMIVFGIGFCLVADSILMITVEQFAWGLFFFAIAALFYTVAFVSVRGSYLTPASGIAFALYAVLILVFLWPDLGNSRVLTVIYVIILAVMGWQALGQWRQTAERRALYAFVGALFFMAAITLLAIDYFSVPLPVEELIILGTYFLGQWFIAMSAGSRHP